MNKIMVVVVCVFAVLVSWLTLYKGVEWPILLFEKTFKIKSAHFEEIIFKEKKFRFSKPLIESSTKETHFPLVVYLHGASERGNDNSKQIEGLRIFGNGFTQKARKFRNQYRCYVYVPQCPEKKSWEGDVLDHLVESIQMLIENNKIDQNRIYLVGYSMGGSGVFSLAQNYYDKTGNYVAAIVRMAGQSSFEEKVYEIISRSGVWLHVGLKDTSRRIEQGRLAYQGIKEHLHDAKEEKSEEVINGQTIYVSRVLVDNSKKVILSEYKSIGHSISSLPFQNDNLFAWLFSQKAQ